MPKMPPTHHPRGTPEQRRRDANRHWDKHRKDKEARKMYSTPQWRELRRRTLQAHPACVLCLKRDGRVVPATICDHIRPHKGDAELFFDPDNVQSLCRLCHDSAKRREERRKT